MLAVDVLKPAFRGNAAARSDRWYIITNSYACNCIRADKLKKRGPRPSDASGCKTLAIPGQTSSEAIPSAATASRRRFERWQPALALRETDAVGER